MSLIGDLFGSFDLGKLFNLILDRFPALRKLFDFAKKIIEHFTGTFGSAVKLFESAQTEFKSWKSFKENIRFTQRVIQIESTIKSAERFWSEIIKAWKDIFSLVKNAGIKLETGAAAEIGEAATGIGLPVAVVNAIVIVIEVLDTVRNVIDTVQNIVDTITDIRKALLGDLFFLQQRNKRKTVTLDDGTKIRLRVGKLHSN
jgi:hypothetical protein